MAKWQTKAWIVVDDEAFYVAFDCDAPTDTSSVDKKKDDGLLFWKDESVELLIASWGAPNKQSIYQFVVNAGGEKTFLRAQEKTQDNLWTASATVRPDGWSAEMPIPLAMFKDRGRNEASWRILFARKSSRRHLQQFSEKQPVVRQCLGLRPPGPVAGQGKLLDPEGNARTTDLAGRAGWRPVPQGGARFCSAAPYYPATCIRPVHRGPISAYPSDGDHPGGQFD
jgi:hypothetical protein